MGRPYPKPANGTGPEWWAVVNDTGLGAVEYIYLKIFEAFERGIPPPRSLKYMIKNTEFQSIIIVT